MNILFIHQNFPGQFGRLTAHMAAQPDCRLVCLGEQKKNKNVRIPGAEVYWYKSPSGAGKDTHHYLRGLEANVRRGQTVYRACRKLRDDGFTADVVYVHPGWGESLYVKDVFPKARVICFYEFYYGSSSRDFNFDPEFPAQEDDYPKVRTKNATHQLTFDGCDIGLSPTEWQKAQFPDYFRDRIRVVHDGIDTDLVKPDPATVVSLNGVGELSAKDEVVTFCNRNLEPYRGFHSFMRALPEILRRRPNCRALLIGDDGVSYGKRLPDGETYKKRYLAETGPELGENLSRVHFLGRIPYSVYLSILRISSVHVYLTYPFVLSWSSMESMAAGCLVVGSDTPPVREVLAHGETGFLVDFFDPAAIAEQVVEVLERREELAPMRVAARERIVQNYDCKTVCLPKLEALIREAGSDA